jgi:PAS domain S-box-containing protein
MAEEIRVLCVDDEPAFLEVEKIFLEQGGELSIDAVLSAPEALNILNKKFYDVIVSDYLMPEMDGIEFLKRVRAVDKTIPFIIFTGRSREEVVIEALNNGANFFLHKEGNTRTLYKELQNIIRQSVQMRRTLITLAEKEQRYHDLQNANDMIQSVAPDGHFFFVNTKWLDTLGYEQHELPNLTIFDVIAEESLTHCMETFQRVISGENVGIIDAVFRARDGKKVYVEGIANCKMVDGQPQYTRGLFKDVTERKMTESAFQTMVRSMVSTTGLNSLQKITENVSSWLGAECVMVGEIQPDKRMVKVLSMLLDGMGVTDFSYTLKGTPCENVAEKGFCLYPDNVIQLFPESKDLVELNIRGYIGTPLRNSAGEVIGVLCALFRSPIKTSPAMQEIMNIIAVKAAAEIERKQAERALADESTKYKILIEQSRDGIVILDQNGKVYDANRRFAEMLGYSSDEIQELYVWDWDTHIERAQLLEMIRTIDEAGDHFETQHYRKDGTILDVEISTNATVFSGKKLIFCVIRDITERKRAEEALKKSEERYRSLLEHVPDLILVHRDGLILFTNHSALKTLGYQPHEALNRQVTDFIAPEFHERVAAAVRQRMSGEPVEPYEIDVLSREGNRSTMIVNGSQIEFEGVPASMIVLVDITERKVLHDAVQLANKKLNLLSSITRHDIINQLLVLNGYLELSRDVLHDPVQLEEYITKQQNITRTIETQIRFTKDYQDLGLKMPVWQNVNECIRNAMAFLHLRDVRIESLPANLEVHADPLFEKVFHNLIDNALRYGGDQMKTIRVSSQESDTSLTIIFEDDGVGITDEDKKKLFQKGFGKHTGLGLFLSREILAITGITITEKGIPGKGARFEITVQKGMYRFV